MKILTEEIKILMKYVRNVLSICLILLISSCQDYSDMENLLLIYEENDTINRIVFDPIDNAIVRYDNRDYVLDKHWFNENGSLYLYTFYNRFYQTEKASFKVNFDDDNEIKKFVGQPFYVSSNLITNDTIKTDTVKAYIYIANSPFLQPKVEIFTKNITTDEDYLIENSNPMHVIYFEDYPNKQMQNMRYCFYYSIDNNNYLYKDSMIYNSVIIKIN